MTQFLNPKRTLLITLLALALGAGAFVVSERLSRYSRAFAQVKTTPFEVDLWTYQYGPGDTEGTLVVKSRKARRSDGAEVNQSTNLKIGFDYSDRVIDYSDGLHVHAVDFLGRKSTLQKGDDEVSFRKARLINYTKGDCQTIPEETVVGHETISGIETIVVRRPTIKNSVSTYWRAPSLACADLGSQRETTTADGKTQLNIKTVAVRLVVDAEPDPSLFAVDSRLQEDSPSGINRAYYVFKNLDLADCASCSQSWAKEDQYYAVHRPRR